MALCWLPWQAPPRWACSRPLLGWAAPSPWLWGAGTACWAACTDATSTQRGGQNRKPCNIMKTRESQRNRATCSVTPTSAWCEQQLIMTVRVTAVTRSACLKTVYRLMSWVSTGEGQVEGGRFDFPEKVLHPSRFKMVIPPTDPVRTTGWGHALRLLFLSHHLAHRVKSWSQHVVIGHRKITPSVFRVVPVKTFALPASI